MQVERNLAAVQLAGLLPAVVKTYDAQRRTCRVEVLGLTDGAEELLEAQLLYPVGDRASMTELEILPGDAVWVMFMGGDPRYPIIMGYRNPMTGNSVGIRAVQHENIHLKAKSSLKLQASEFNLTGSNVTLTGNINLDGVVKINGVVQVGN